MHHKARYLSPYIHISRQAELKIMKLGETWELEEGTEREALSLMKAGQDGQVRLTNQTLPYTLLNINMEPEK